MKTLIIAMMVLITGTVASAGAKDKLVSSIKKQIRIQEKQIITMWLAGNQEKELEKILADYVVKNIRLQAMNGNVLSGTLYAKVNSMGKEFKSTRDLAKALVIEHFKTKGVDLGELVFVHGTYALKVVDER